MMDTGLIIKLKALANLNLVMEPFTRDTGIKILLMALAFILTVMDICIKDIGLWINNMDSVRKHYKMDQYIKELSKMD